MKKIFTTFLVSVFVIFMNAQVPPNPNGNGAAPDGGNTPVGGGAYIGGGVGILLVLGAGYGLKKLLDNKLRRLND